MIEYLISVLLMIVSPAEAQNTETFQNYMASRASATSISGINQLLFLQRGNVRLGSVSGLQTFLGNQIIPQQFGATGNGTTDDTAALQSTFNAASSAGINNVFIPCGTYLVSSTVNLSFVGFTGAGMGCVVIKTTANIPIFTVTSNAGSMHYGGVTFKGSVTGNSAQVGLLVASGLTNFIHNVIENINCDSVTTCFESSMAVGTNDDWNILRSITAINVKTGLLWDNSSGTGNVISSSTIVGGTGLNGSGIGINFRGTGASSIIGDITIANVQFGGPLAYCFNFGPTGYGSNISLVNWQCDGGPTGIINASSGSEYSLKLKDWNRGGTLQTTNMTNQTFNNTDIDSQQRNYGAAFNPTNQPSGGGSPLFTLTLQPSQYLSVDTWVYLAGLVGSVGQQARTSSFHINSPNNANCGSTTIDQYDTHFTGTGTPMTFTVSPVNCVFTFMVNLPPGNNTGNSMDLSVRATGPKFDVQLTYP